MLPDFRDFTIVEPDTVCLLAPPPHTVLIVAAQSTKAIANTKHTNIKSRPGPTMFSMMRAQRMYRMVQRVQTSTSYAPVLNFDLDQELDTAKSVEESDVKKTTHAHHADNMV